MSTISAPLRTRSGLCLVPFWQGNSVFSNHYVSQQQFLLDGEHFTCTEQFFMLQKALLFGDEAAAQRIRQPASAQAPIKLKKIGREVSNFDSATWVHIAPVVMLIGCHAKFVQNEHLRQELVATEGSLLVEASPRDRLWGAGLSATSLRLLEEHPSTWPGRNLMGEVLMTLRDHIGESTEEGASEEVVTPYRDQETRTKLTTTLVEYVTLQEENSKQSHSVTSFMARDFIQKKATKQ